MNTAPHALEFPEGQIKSKHNLPTSIASDHEPDRSLRHLPTQDSFQYRIEPIHSVVTKLQVFFRSYAKRGNLRLSRTTRKTFQSFEQHLCSLLYNLKSEQKDGLFVRFVSKEDLIDLQKLFGDPSKFNQRVISLLIEIKLLFDQIYLRDLPLHIKEDICKSLHAIDQEIGALAQEYYH